MFNAGVVHEAELMREVAAMRLAEQASQGAETTLRSSSPTASLAFRIAHWRRLSTYRFFPKREDVVVTLPRPHGV
jgi:hypothetical protein